MLFLCIEVCGPQQFARGGVPKEALRFHRAPNACRPVCLSHRAFASLGACANCPRGRPKRSLAVSPRSKRVPPRVSISPGFRAPRRVRDLPAEAPKKEALRFHRIPNACRPVCLSHQAFAPIRRVRDLPAGASQKKPCCFTALQTRAAPCVLSRQAFAPSGAYANCPRGHPKRSLMVSPRPKRVPPRVSIPPGFRAHQARARLESGGTPLTHALARQWDSGWRP